MILFEQVSFTNIDIYFIMVIIIHLKGVKFMYLNLYHNIMEFIINVNNIIKLHIAFNFLNLILL